MVTGSDTNPPPDVNISVTDPVTVPDYVAPMEVIGRTPGERIAMARKARGLTQDRLAELIGTSKQQVSRLEGDDRKLQASWAERIGRALSVSPEALLFGKGVTVSQSTVASRTVEIVELDVRAAAGAGLENGDQPPEISRWTVPRDLVAGVTTASPDRMRVITIYGDSMEPTFAPGARVLVDTEDRTPSPPGIFVVFDGLGLVCKRLEFLPRSDPPSVRLTSDNPRYSSYDCPLADAHIQGRVIARWQWT